MNKLTSWPNLITCARIMLALVLVIVYYLPISHAHTVAAIVFVLASFSDWLDGYVARTYGLMSRFGAFLDPVADKVIVAIALVILVGEQHDHFLVIPSIIIIAREIIVSGLREWMAEVGKRASITVSYIGKCKTALQMLAITLLLITSDNTLPILAWVGHVLLYIAAILTLWSMVMYLKTAWPILGKL